MSKLFFILFSFIQLSSSGQEVFQRKLTMLTSPFEVTVVANDSVQANKYIDAAIAETSRIENLLSDWKPESQISKVNQNAGIQSIKVDDEIFELIKRAIKISILTDGAFDISYASMDNIWKFDGSMKQMPSSEAIKKSLEKVGYQKIILDENKKTILLRDIGMKLGLGGIAQGFIADKIKKLLVEMGCTSGIANVSGDISAWGKQPDGKPWTVGIVNPLNKTKAFGLLPITHGAVVTSGNYEKFVTFNNVRYSHIIDPRTGYPASKIISVTVFAPKAELADALATSIFVMGSDVGINMVDQIPNTECIIIDDEGKIYKSQNININ